MFRSSPQYIDSYYSATTRHLQIARPRLDDPRDPDVCVVAPATRVTRTSAPTLDSGESTFACAVDKPCDTPISPINRSPFVFQYK